MPDYISISALNDFIFCPYSIYLHNVYMDTDEDLYHATPQTKGKAAHQTVDGKTYSHSTNDIVALPVYSDEFGLMGKIDIYKQKERLLIERKYQLNKIYRGQLYQLWAQYFCLTEMGYLVEHITFYELSTNKTHNVNLPTDSERTELKEFIARFKAYDLDSNISVNANKCVHCIYCNLCDKTELNNVYT